MGHTPSTMNGLSSRKQKKKVKRWTVKEYNKNESEHGTALHRAVLSNRPEKVERALKKGVDLDDRTCQCGMTAVHLAVKMNLEDILEVLMEKGADINIPSINCERSTPLTTVKDRRRRIDLKLEDKIEIAKQKLFKGKSFTPLITAIKKDNTTIVRRLLVGNANPDGIEQCDDYWDRRSPLMVAADIGRPAILLLLLNKGADVNLRSGRRMKTALHFATSGRALEILWEWGADINACDRTGETPLQSALNQGKLEAIEALLSLGPPPFPCGNPSIQAYQIMIKFQHVYPNNIYTLKQSEFHDTEHFESLCSLEVRKMKDTKFDEINGFCKIELFIMLMKQLTAYDFARNKNMCEFIESNNCKRDFPLYHTILRRRLRIAKRRLSLTRNSIAMFISLIENYQNISLPVEVCDEIFFYLSSADLINFNRTLDNNFLIEAEAEDMNLPLERRSSNIEEQDYYRGARPLCWSMLLGGSK